MTPTRCLAVRSLTMNAKSFMALDGNGCLMGARTAQTPPYDCYTCHLCGSPLQYHPEYQTERPWFEHRYDELIENGRQHFPYVIPGLKESSHIRQLQCYVPNARPLAFMNDWHCSGCSCDYRGERYCPTCRIGDYSRANSDATNKTAEVP